MQRRDGNFELSHMDEFIDSLLREERINDVQLPRYEKMKFLEECLIGISSGLAVKKQAQKI